MEIKVVDIRFLPSNGKPTRAFADVQLDDIIIKDFRIMQNNEGKIYVRVPFTTHRDKAGELIFRYIVDLPIEMRGRVNALILNEYYQKKEKKNGHQTSE